jgi:hypothetical protein
MDPSPIDLHVHPPERRRARTVALPCGCCCCCCCLHSIGGLIGALIGTFIPGRRPPEPYPPPGYYGEQYVPPPVPRRSSALPAAGLYWIILAMLTMLVFLVSCVGYAHELAGPGIFDGVGAGLLILAIFLPGVQIVASLIAMLAAALTDTQNAAARLWTIGKITLGTLLGTGVGIGIMFLFAVLGRAW